MSALFSGKAILIAVGISLLLTGATYFVTVGQLDNLLPVGSAPWNMQYTIFVTDTSSPSQVVTMSGWPFTYILGNSAVIIFSSVAFIIDIIVFLVIAFLVLWMLLRNDSVYDYVAKKTTKPPVTKQ